MVLVGILRESKGVDVLMARMQSTTIDIFDPFVEKPRSMAAKLDQLQVNHSNLTNSTLFPEFNINNDYYGKQVLVQNLKGVVQHAFDAHGVTPEANLSSLATRSQNLVAGSRQFAAVDVKGDIDVSGNFVSNSSVPARLRPIRLSAVDAVLYELELNSMRKTLEFLHQRIEGFFLVVFLIYTII